MPIQLNEVPNAVLNGLTRHAFARACCTSTAILCLLPSFGGSVGMCEERGICPDAGNTYACYDGCLSDVEKTSIDGLKRGLQAIIHEGNRRVQSQAENPEVVALVQSDQTLALISQVRITINSLSYMKFLDTQTAVIKEKMRLHGETQSLLRRAVQETIFEQPRASAMDTSGLPPYSPTK